MITNTREARYEMTRRKLAEMFLGLIGLGGTAGCGGGMNEETITASTLRIRIRLNHGVEKTIEIPQGSTVLTAISRRPFYCHQREDGTTVIKGIRGHWRYTINGAEPHVYAGSYHLYNNCRIDLRLI